MKQELETLRTEVRELRATVEMLLSMMVEGDRSPASSGSGASEENPQFYN
jgi:hypothetical protein